MKRLHSMGACELGCGAGLPSDVPGGAKMQPGGLPSEYGSTFRGLPDIELSIKQVVANLSCIYVISSTSVSVGSNYVTNYVFKLAVSSAYGICHPHRSY